MKVNEMRRAYEAPKAEVVMIDTQMNVLMASPIVVVPDADINGNGITFTEDQGQW